MVLLRLEQAKMKHAEFELELPAEVTDCFADLRFGEAGHNLSPSHASFYDKTSTWNGSRVSLLQLSSPILSHPQQLICPEVGDGAMIVTALSAPESPACILFVRHKVPAFRIVLFTSPGFTEVNPLSSRGSSV